MAKKIQLLSSLLRKKTPQNEDEVISEHSIKALQLKMLRIQQGLWHSKKRAIIVFEGFDAAGKGGAIRRITEMLDPRGIRVHPIGPPTESEQGKHYLSRFWSKLPEPGALAIFDRSWYGRVLVERVENLTPKKRLQEAYSEISDFEAMLIRDGIDIVKIFLAISQDEQLKRFRARLHDPYKQWKLTTDDLEAHKKWHAYVTASDDLLKRTNHKPATWHLVPADSKEYARGQVLKIVTRKLAHHGEWIETIVQKKHRHELSKALHQLEKFQMHPTKKSN